MAARKQVTPTKATAKKTGAKPSPKAKATATKAAAKSTARRSPKMAGASSVARAPDIESMCRTSFTIAFHSSIPNETRSTLRFAVQRAISDAGGIVISNS